MKTAHRILWALALVLGLMLLVPRAEAAEGTCGSGVTWKLDETTGHMTVSGTGKMTSASGWSAYKEQLIHLTVEEGVTSLCSYAFLNFQELESVTLPQSLTSIGMGAFRNCIALEELVLPEVCNLGMDAFSNCKRLPRVTLPRSEYTNSGIFSDCKALEEIILPENCTSIGADAFSNCTALCEITIPASVTTMDMRAFSGCTDLARIRVMGNLTTLTGGCSASPRALSGIYFYAGAPKTITSVAFDNCPDGLVLYYTEGAAGWDSVTAAPTAVFDPDEALPDLRSKYAFAREVDALLATVTGGTRIFSASLLQSDFSSTLEGEALLREKALQVTEGCTTDAQRIRKIADFVSANVYYDTELKAPEAAPGVSATDTLAYGIGVCEHYANLSCAMIRALDIPCIAITGFAGECNDLHAWNAAHDGTRWIYFDTTWNSRNKYSFSTKTFETNGITDYYWDMTPQQALHSADHRAFLIQGLESEDLHWYLYVDPDTGDAPTVSIRGTASREVTEITIPGEIRGVKVTQAIFWEDPCIKKVTWSGEEVFYLSFQNATALEEVVLMPGVKTIKDDAFRGCASLKKVTIADTVTHIGNNVFFDCTALEHLTIPRSVTECGTYLVRGCTSLRWLDLQGPGCNFINASEFRDLTDLQWIRFPAVPIRVATYGFLKATVPTLIFTGDAPIFENTGAPVKAFGSAGTVYYPAGNETWAGVTPYGVSMVPFRPGFTAEAPANNRLSAVFAPAEHPEADAVLMIAVYNGDGRMAALREIRHDPDALPIHTLQFAGRFAGTLRYKAFWLTPEGFVPLYSSNPMT